MESNFAVSICNSCSVVGSGFIVAIGNTSFLSGTGISEIIVGFGCAVSIFTFGSETTGS